MPQVSVIIPTYNRAHLLRESIESVLSQTHRDLELIVVDDGSTDDTEKVVSSYLPHLTYLYQEHQGVSAARNKGLERAQGNYLTFLDSDDLWLPTKLQLQMRFMKHHPDALICYTEEIWIRRGVRVNPMKKHKKYSGMIFEYCLPRCIVSPSSVLIDPRVLDDVGTFDETFEACEDYDLWLRISSRYPIYLIDTPLIVKRGGHDDQLSHTIISQDQFRIKALVKLLNEDHLTSQQKELALKELKRKCEIYGKGCIKRGKREEGEKFLTLPAKYSTW